MQLVVHLKGYVAAPRTSEEWLKYLLPLQDLLVFDLLSYPLN